MIRVYDLGQEDRVKREIHIHDEISKVMKKCWTTPAVARGREYSPEEMALNTFNDHSYAFRNDCSVPGIESAIVKADTFIKARIAGLENPKEVMITSHCWYKRRRFLGEKVWGYRGSRGWASTQEWIDRMDERDNILYLAVCNPKNYDVRSRQALLVYPDNIFGDNGDGKGERSRTKLFAPEIGLITAANMQEALRMLSGK